MITFLFRFQVLRSWCKSIIVGKRADTVENARLKVVKDYPNCEITFLDSSSRKNTDSPPPFRLMP